MTTGLLKYHFLHKLCVISRQTAEAGRQCLSTSTVVSSKAKAVAKAKMMAQMTDRKRMEVETDSEKLVKFVCGANTQTDVEPPKIRPDAEYPDWLWSLYTGRDRETLMAELKPDEHQYWRMLKRRQREHNSLIQKTRNKFKIFTKKETV